MTGSNLWTDGNALAGPLRDVIGPDVTAAIGRCGNCGRTGPMAEVRVFDHAPGMVARCPVCDQVLLRMVRGPGRAWLDLRGLTYLQFPVRTGRDLSRRTFSCAASRQAGRRRRVAPMDGPSSSGRTNGLPAYLVA